MPPETRMALLTSLLMSFCLALFFSGFFTLLRFGATAQWLATWPRGFALAWPLGFAMSFLLGAPIRRLSARLAGLG